MNQSSNIIAIRVWILFFYAVSMQLIILSVYPAYGGYIGSIIICFFNVLLKTE